MYYFIEFLLKYSFNIISMKNSEAKYHNIIAGNIRYLRQSKKLSQEKLAELLNCSREFISRVENNKERISLNMLFKIAEVFKISPSNMFKHI